MVAGKDNDVVWIVFFDRVDVLENSIRVTPIPIFIQPLLSRHGFDEFPLLPIDHVSPSLVDVAVETHGLELSQHQNAIQIAVDAIGKRKVDDSVDAAEWDRRFGIVIGKWCEACTFTAGQKQCCDS